MGERAADHAGADKGDLVARHVEGIFAFELSRKDAPEDETGQRGKPEIRRCNSAGGIFNRLF